MAALGDFDLRAATAATVAAVGALNREIEAAAPWKLLADPATHAELDALLARWTSTLREIARVTAPVVPDLSARLLDDAPLFSRLAV